MKRPHFLALAMLLLASAQLSAGTLLIDRGLPVANLNSKQRDEFTGATLRSNIGWAYGIMPVGARIVGDSFQNTSSSTYFIDKIRLWTIGDVENTSLWGGIEGSSINHLPGVGLKTLATYADGSSYQFPNDSFGLIYQFDFNVNLSLDPGMTYDFFLDGNRSAYPYVPCLHASDADLSGSPQDGSDNLMLWIDVSNGSIVPGSYESWGSNGWAWDKPTDINVQVFGTTSGTVPDGFSTLLLVGFALTGLSALKWRKNN